MNERDDFQFPTAQSQRCGNGSDVRHEFAAGMRGSLTHARQRIGESMTSAQERSRQMMGHTSGYIKRWPFSAIAVAAGVGLLLGWLLAHQSRDDEMSSERARWWR